MKGILVAALMGLITANAQALDPTRAISQYAHTAWRNRDGYFASAPSAITQTEDGYIWVGTATGLLRFDGVRFTLWTAPKEGSELQSAEILSLLASRDGSLWIGTARGLARWYNGVLTNYASNPVHINSIHEDQGGHIWIIRSRIHDGTGPLCEAVGSKLNCYGKEDGIPEPQATSLALDSSENFWIGGDGEMTRWTPHSARTFPTLDRRRNYHTQIGSLAPSVDGGLWVGLSGTGRGQGLQRFEKEAWKPITIGRFDGSSLEMPTLFIDSRSSLWAGALTAGIYRIRYSFVEHFDTADGLSGDDVRSFFEDKEHNLWVTTSAGIDCFRDMPVVRYSKREGLTSDEPNSVVASPDGTVWVGVVGGLDAIHDGVVSPIRTSWSLPGTEVTAMLVDRTGRLWLGVDDGLYLYEQGRFHPILDRAGGRSGNVTGLAEDVDGSIWAAVQDSKANLLSHIRGDVITEQFPEKIGGVAADPHGGVWLTLPDAIAHRQNGLQKSLKIPPGLHVDNSADIVSDPQGALWASIGQGVLRFNGEKAQLLGTSNGPR